MAERDRGCAKTNDNPKEKNMTTDTPPQMPTPAPALRALDPFVGTWKMTGKLAGADEATIHGEATFRWLPGGFFLEQRIRLDFMGMEIDSLELIGFDPEAGGLASTVYSNLAPTPLPYRWEVNGRDVRIIVTYGPLDATFTGTMSDDGQTFAGGWRPNPGADASINVPYDIEGRRADHHRA